MKRYKTGKTGLSRLLTVVLTVSLLTVLSCADEFEKAGKAYNLTLNTRAGETAAQQIPYIRLFNSHSSGANLNMFYQEVLNLVRGTDKITAQIETGQWNMALVSNPNGGTIIPPAPNTLMSQTPLYKYAPVYPANGKTTDADEMYLENQLTPVIDAITPQTMTAQLNRTVAKVKLVIEKTTPNFNLSSTRHKIKLHNIPSTISYTGNLLPSAANPDTLARALEAPVTLVNPGGGSTNFEGSEAIVFMIPAHRGDAYTAGTPTDVVGVKMSVTLELERTGGTMFAKQMEIPMVAQCNKVLEVKITVNDGLEFKTKVLDWEGVDISSNVGAGYQNWLYVKQNATGNGLSWSDPLPSISTAIAKAQALTAAGKTVNGILVAGGAGLTYAESFTVPANVKIFSGWKGDAGTEFASTATVPDLYASTHRDLKTYKARVATATGSIVLAGANAVIDGFVVTGQALDAGSLALLHINNASAYANAVEITGNSAIASGKHALRIDAGTAANILCAQNSGGIHLCPSGSDKAVLLNATVAENTGLSDITTGTLLNCVFWKNNTITYSTVTTKAQYSAFNPTDLANIPSGTNVPLSATNNEWFTAIAHTPGPHFAMNATPGRQYYEPGTSKPNRAPMLRRGSKALFDSNFPVALADAYKQDIDGKIRYHVGIDGNDVVDMGCYEDGSLSGFQLRWATDRVYVSAKLGYFSQLPLLIPANEDPDINIEIGWTITIQGGSLTQCSFDGAVVGGVVTGSNNGIGTGVMVGMVQFTPTVEYTTNAERQLGTVTISSNLGNYLPDEAVQVWQTKGVRSEWKTGYVGSFHRNNERGARFIHAYNTGDWTARIISGLDWIKIDENDKDYGVNITDSDEGTTPGGGYYKEVEEKWGGAIIGRTGYVKFRVGMKSKNTTGKPRYGLIVITRSGGVSYFFVRQGEADDYLYTMADNSGQKPTTGARSAASVVKFSTYNITTNQTPSATGHTLTVNGGGFTKYPSQFGCYFKWNSLVGFFNGITTSTAGGSTASSWSTTREVCPAGYRHPTYLDYCNSIYWNVANSTSVSPSGEYVTLNREWGAYADGYYDQLVTSPLSNSGTVTLAVGSGAGRADKGVLMVSHYNYASIFFPAAATLNASGVIANGNYAMYPTTYSSSVNTHWYDSHIGMSCTTIGSNAAPVRCVKE